MPGGWLGYAEVTAAQAIAVGTETDLTGLTAAETQALFLLAGPASSQTPDAGTKLRWYKGNTHTHTTMSDGDSTPGLVARWYRNNGYDFLFLTDHNIRTEIEDLNSEIARENQELKAETAFLKKASAYFAREQRQ